MIECKEEYFLLLNDIKNTLVTTRNKILENANKELILMYYDIGLKLLKNNKWGTSFIDILARDIKSEFSNLKGMSARNLRYMQKFAKEFDNDVNVNTKMYKKGNLFMYKKRNEIVHLI